MEHFVGLDVSVRETSLCVVDHAGKIVKEARVPTEPEAIIGLLGKGGFAPKRVGLEAGPMSQWLYAGLAEAAGRPLDPGRHRPAVDAATQARQSQPQEPPLSGLS